MAQYAPYRQCERVTLLDQCMTEQLYVRDSIVRALMYLQVSDACDGRDAQEPAT